VPPATGDDEIGDAMNENGLAQAIQNIEHAVASLHVAEIPALTGDLKRLETLALARLMPKPEQNKENYLTPQQVAERLAVPPSYVYELARRGELAARKMGKYVRFTEAAVRTFQAKQGVDRSTIPKV
jgi:excisionase family DNA binding protein